MLELLIMDADVLKDMPKFQKAMELVGLQRRNKIEKMVKEENKRLSLAAGLLLRHAFLSINRLELYNEIQITEKGKPFLPNHDYYFSLSHSGRFGICGFSQEPIGCDIERMREKLPKVANIFSKEEEKTFLSLDDMEKRQFFFQVWTSKESVTKWMGVGIGYPFYSFSVMNERHIRNSVIMENKTLFLKSYRMEDYVISLSTEAGIFPGKLREIDWNILSEN